MFTIYHASGRINKNEMGGAFSAYGGEEDECRVLMRTLGKETN